MGCLEGMPGGWQVGTGVETKEVRQLCKQVQGEASRQKEGQVHGAWVATMGSLRTTRWLVWLQRNEPEGQWAGRWWERKVVGRPDVEGREGLDFILRRMGRD